MLSVRTLYQIKEKPKNQTEDEDEEELSVPKQPPPRLGSINLTGEVWQQDCQRTNKLTDKSLVTL